MLQESISNGGKRFIFDPENNSKGLDFVRDDTPSVSSDSGDETLFFPVLDIKLRTDLNLDKFEYPLTVAARNLYNMETSISHSELADSLYTKAKFIKAEKKRMGLNNTPVFIGQV